MFKKEEYHPKWSLISRLVRLKRAKNRCEWCGAKNYKTHPSGGGKVFLTVAHIDGDRSNNKFINLAASCRSCYVTHHLQRNINNSKPGRSWQDSQLSLNF